MLPRKTLFQDTPVLDPTYLVDWYESSMRETLNSPGYGEGGNFAPLQSGHWVKPKGWWKEELPLVWEILAGGR